MATITRTVIIAPKNIIMKRKTDTNNANTPIDLWGYYR